MRKLIAVTAMLAVIAGLAVNVSLANKEEEKKKPKTIKEVMKVAFKGGSKALLKKVASTKKKSTEKENKELLSLLKDMAKGKPPKGDQKSWDKFNKTLLEPAQAIVDGKDIEKAKKALKKAGSCGKCHKAHKPKKDD